MATIETVLRVIAGFLTGFLARKGWMEVRERRNIIAQRAIRRWRHRGLQAAIVPAPLMSYNGYVRLPRFHRWRRLPDSDIPVEVSGGLTYGPDPYGWIGFDTSHAFDVWEIDDENVPSGWEPLIKAKREMAKNWPHSRSHVWTLDLLKEEVDHLAQQVPTWRGRIFNIVKPL